MFTNQNKNQESSYFMRLALQQARISLGNTKENPAVGCVIVKNNHLISVGHTSVNGRPHAEQNAINCSKISPQNSELYVTLEPCSHFGETPPCVKSIIKSKVKKVFFSISDPDPRSFNKCSLALERRGIAVNNKVLKNEIKFFYFIHNIVSNSYFIYYHIIKKKLSFNRIRKTTNFLFCLRANYEKRFRSRRNYW